MERERSERPTAFFFLQGCLSRFLVYAVGHFFRFAIETEIGIRELRKGYVRHLDTCTYMCKDGPDDTTKFYRPVNEKFGGVQMPARTRAILTSRKNKPLTCYEILERHCDSINNDLMVVVDSPHCGVSLKLTNFMSGYIKAHKAEVKLPQWGACMSRGIINRYFKSVEVKMGSAGRSAELLVKTKTQLNEGTCRICLVMYLDLRRPSHRWKVGNLCKHILREMKRTFQLQIDLPDVDADCINMMGPAFEQNAKLGDIVLVLDGIDAIDDSKEDDPLHFLPQHIPSCIR